MEGVGGEEGGSRARQHEGEERKGEQERKGDGGGQQRIIKESEAGQEAASQPDRQQRHHEQQRREERVREQVWQQSPSGGDAHDAHGQHHHVRADGDDKRVWCATCGRFEQPGDTGPAVIRVEQQDAGHDASQTPSFQQWAREEALEYYRRHQRHEQMLQRARNATSAAPFSVRAASPELSGRSAAFSAPSQHRTVGPARSEHSHHGAHEEGDETGTDGDMESERQSLVGKPSLEVIHQPPVLPSLGHDPLACLSYINRTNEVLRNFQGNVAVMLGQAGAEKQSEELFRYVPPQLGFTPHHIEALENESATQPLEVNVAPEMDKLLNICVGLLSRVQHGFQRSIEALLSKDRTLIQDLTSENATLRERLQQQAGEVDDLEAHLQVEQQRHSEVLYTWPAMSNDALVMERMRGLQRAHRQLQEAHEEVLTEFTNVRRENAELRTQLQTQHHAPAHQHHHQHQRDGGGVTPTSKRRGPPPTTAASTSAAATAATATATATVAAAARAVPPSANSKQQQQQQQQEEGQQQQQPIKNVVPVRVPHASATVPSGSGSDDDEDEDVHTSVNVFRGVTGAGLDASLQQLTISRARSATSVEAKMSTYSQTAAERLAKVPDLKLACLFQMYITLKRSQAMTETASHEFRLVRRRLELTSHRISQWRDNKVGDWGIRLQQLAAIQDQLALLVAATQPKDLTAIPSTTTFGAVSSGTTIASPSSSSAAATAQTGSSDSIAQHRSMLGGPRRRRSTLTFGEASDRYWMSNITSGLDETVDNSWLVTPHSLVLQVSRAHNGPSPSPLNPQHGTPPATPATTPPIQSRTAVAGEGVSSTQRVRGGDGLQGSGEQDDSSTADSGGGDVARNAQRRQQQMLGKRTMAGPRSSRSTTRPRSRSPSHGHAHVTAKPKPMTAASSSTAAQGTAAGTGGVSSSAGAPPPSVNTSLFLDALNAVSIPTLSPSRQHGGHKAAAATTSSVSTTATVASTGATTPAATATRTSGDGQPGGHSGTSGGGNAGNSQELRLPPLT